MSNNDRVARESMQWLANTTATIRGIAKTKREGMFLNLGLRISHAEEALTVGDEKRAMAHMEAAYDILKQLRSEA